MRAIARGLAARRGVIVFPRRLMVLLRLANLLPARLGDAAIRLTASFRIAPETEA